jgi:hypothetical protein
MARHVRPLLRSKELGAPKPREFEIAVNTNWEMILQSSVLTAGAEAITRGLVQTPKSLCSHCGEEGHIEWQCLYKMSDEEMSLARNDKQDKDDDDKKEGEEEPEVEYIQLMSAEAPVVKSSSADEDADEDDDEPEDFDEEQDNDMEMI